jgi:hypothetical protein
VLFLGNATVPPPCPQERAAPVRAFTTAVAIVKFRAAQLRHALLGITEVQGVRGFWPLRKPVHYRIGVNCDAIRIQGNKIVVSLGPRPIAVARYAPKRPDGDRGGDIKWEQLLQPRDRNKN